MASDDNSRFQTRESLYILFKWERVLLFYYSQKSFALSLVIRCVFDNVNQKRVAYAATLKLS